MRGCDETVTVYNARVDPVSRMEAYVPTVLAGVGWHGRVASRAAAGGAQAANGFVLRIPEGVAAEGKAFAEPVEYRAAGDVGGLWTLQKGDMILRGECREALTPARLRQRFGAERTLTVTQITDNRTAGRGRHWRVEGDEF